jgi:hypothetical protein
MLGDEDKIMSSSHKWKKTEKEVAEIFNTKRNPFSGSNGGISHSDSIHPQIFIEAKTRESHPIMNLYKDTEILAQNEGKIPILALRENDSEKMLLCTEKRNLFEILKLIDLSYYDAKFEKGTTLDKILKNFKASSGPSIFDLNSELTAQINVILNKKILTNDDRNIVQMLSFLIYCSDSILNYINNR